MRGFLSSAVVVAPWSSSFLVAPFFFFPEPSALPVRRRAGRLYFSWEALGSRAARKVEGDVASGARLLVCPTPLGEASDVTFRVIAALRRADVIACEDTRKTGSLLKELGVVRERQKLRRHDATTAGKSALELVREIVRNDRVVALVSDAGTPGISDPGAYLVKVAADVGVKVVALPGACAATTALSLSGVDAGEGFLFAGFPAGRTPTQRRRELAKVLDEAEKRPVVVFESPRRIRDTVKTLNDMLPGIRLVVARELTKTHENVFRGFADDCLAWLDTGAGAGGPGAAPRSNPRSPSTTGTTSTSSSSFSSEPPRGEFTLVVDHKGRRRRRRPSSLDDDDDDDDQDDDDKAAPEEDDDERDSLDVARELLAAKRAAGLSLASAAKQVARQMDLSKSDVYRLAIDDEKKQLLVTTTPTTGAAAGTGADS